MSARRLVLRIPPELDGTRLDRALAALVPDLSRGRLREMVEDGRVRVGGAPARKPSQPVDAGAELEVELVERDRTRAGSLPGLALAILHEDAHLVGVDKPAGMVVHPSSVVRGGTVSELLAERYGDLPRLQGEDRPGIVHRLDKDTSGVLVAARTEEAARELLRQFREREVEKGYLALVEGAPRFDADWITAPLSARGAGPGRPDRVSVARAGEGRRAETFYEVRERFDEFALLACRPVTGRTHQIRVHLASIGHPVAFDTVYRAKGGKATPRPAGAPRLARHALHAERLALRHPATGERLELVAPLAADMAELLTFLRG